MPRGLPPPPPPHATSLPPVVCSLHMGSQPCGPACRGGGHDTPWKRWGLRAGEPRATSEVIEVGVIVKFSCMPCFRAGLARFKKPLAGLATHGAKRNAWQKEVHHWTCQAMGAPGSFQTQPWKAALGIASRL